MNINPEDQQKIYGLIKALLPEVTVILYGSRARGTHSDSSDVDIAVESKTPLTRVDVGEVRDVLNATNIPHKFDVVDLNRVSPDMKTIIKKEGIEWTS